METKIIYYRMSGTIPLAVVNVSITNKDSIGGIVLPLREKSVEGTAYVILSYPIIFDGVIAPLTTTLRAVRNFSGEGYDNSSPDTFVIAGYYDSLNAATAEPPNGIQNRFWEIRFDSIYNAGQPARVELDSVFISPDTTLGFIDLQGNKFKVNFFKSSIYLCPGTCGDSFPTFIEEIHSSSVPKTYILSQNHPNPFNANTQITIALPKSGRTTLEVFNVLGQKVSTLVDEHLIAGTKIVNWDGRDDRGAPVPSGVYFYQLQSGEFRETKKMLVLK